MDQEDDPSTSGDTMNYYSYRSADENDILPDNNNNNTTDTVIVVTDNISGAEETVIVDCPIKRRTDDLGGIKVQIYGLDSYGYIQYNRTTACSMPQELMTKNTDEDEDEDEDEGESSSFFVLTLQEQEDEWIDFWTIRVDPIMNKHKQYEWLIRSWIVVGIFLCTTLMAILVRDDGHGDDHVALWIVSAIAMGVVVLLWRASSYPKSCQRELAELCIWWSHDQKQKQNHWWKLVSSRNMVLPPIMGGMHWVSFNSCLSAQQHLE